MYIYIYGRLREGTDKMGKPLLRKSTTQNLKLNLFIDIFIKLLLYLSEGVVQQ